MAGVRDRSASRRDTAARAYVAAGTAVIVIYLVLSSAARYMLPVLIQASVVCAISVGVVRNKPRPALPWWLFACAMAPYAAADAIWGLYQARGAEVPFPGLADMLYLGTYVLFTAGVVILARQQAGRLHWAGLLDAGIVTLGFATLSWAFIIAPFLRSEMSAWPLAVSIAYPVIDLVLLSVAARLVLTTRMRTPSLLLCIGWLLVLLAADGLYYGTMATTGTAIAEDVSEVGWMVSSLLLGAAALHPSAARSPRVAADQERLPHRRLSVLIALIAMGPLIVLADVGGIRGRPLSVTVIVGLMASLSLLLVLRVAFLAQYAQSRAAEARTRARALAESLREQAELQKQLAYQATHDPLTSLANRALLNERLESVLGRCSAVSPAGLVMLDLDGFKDVNDTLGHPAGDELLVDVARRLTSRVREKDLVARLGGDEFALLVEGVDMRTLHNYTLRILDSFADPFFLAHGRSVHVTTSIGVRSISGPTAPAEVMRDADTALYRAKTAGKNQAAFSDSAEPLSAPPRGSRGAPRKRDAEETT